MHRFSAYFRALVVLVALLASGVAGAQPGPSPDPEPSAPTTDGVVDYERHMANGIKLFGDEDFNGAIVEFEAAYDAQPKASPLINIALAYKKLREPAKAIEALERALRDHEDTTPDDQKEAAKREITELRALIAYVAIDVSPPDAKVFIDQRPVAPKDLEDGMLELSPGVRSLRITARGYEPREQSITVRSGSRNEKVVVALEPTKGQLSVVAQSDEDWIEVDGKKLGQGKFEGSLPPGLHIIRIIDDSGDAQRLDVVVTAGGRAEVTQKQSGELFSTAAAPDGQEDDDDFGPPAVLKKLRGLYFQGSGALLTAVPLEGQAKNFTAETGPGRFGGSGGVNIGYRVNNWAGFELFGQVSDIRMNGSILITDPQILADSRVEESIPSVQMKLFSFRFGGMMRVMLPTDGTIRFVGNVGGGAAYEELRFREGKNGEGDILDLPPPYNASQAQGFGFIAQVDFGIELEVENILFDLVVMNVFQSSKHFDAENEFNGVARVFNAFNTAPILVSGPAVRVGYALW